MSDQREQLQKHLDEMAEEFRRGLDQANKMCRAMADDLGVWVSGSIPGRKGSSQHPADAIRDLAALKEEGHISEEEYESKKAELLRRM